MAMQDLYFILKHKQQEQQTFSLPNYPIRLFYDLCRSNMRLILIMYT